MFKGGTSLPSGDITTKCGSHESVVPCPAVKVYCTAVYIGRV